MHRGGPFTLDKSQLFRLPSKHSTGRATRPDIGFRPVNLSHESRIFLPGDPRMSVVRLFTAEGERLPQETPYGTFVVRAMKQQVAFEALPQHQRAIPVDSAVWCNMQQSAMEHMNAKLATTRQAPFFIVMREMSSWALFAAELRSLESIGGKITPYLVDRNGDLGIPPQGLAGEAAPHARSRASGVRWR